MKTNEIRSAFLNFFAAQQHRIVSSSSLIPAGDPTLLFANSGMVQFKDCFLGTDVRPYKRATTCQKSLRISGKHNDLENVGRTARHHTFFEMLGNFSFGDYFKRDAISFAWEFVTTVLKLPQERLWVTIFENDDEALALWKSETDVNPERIVRRGAKDNFWAMGETGPCGPCTEIFYYLGENVAGQSVEEFNLDDGTYIEIWNLVFMQFNRDIQGNISPLPKPSVDTGMGLERVAAIMQGKVANYDGDLLRSLIAATEELSGRKYLGEDYAPRDAQQDAQYADDVALRVIADHSRAAAFLIADGIAPASDGRGYVLRRLIRRACRHGRVLGLRQPFLHKIATKVIELMAADYPELETQRNKIEQLIKAEEEKFLATLDTGLAILNKEVEAVTAAALRVFSGATAFQLHDTYGFPLDLTEDIVQAHGLTVDTEQFSHEMEKQRERSRAARAGDMELILQRAVKPTKTEFVGYTNEQYESEVLGIYDKDGECASAVAGDESSGQVVIVTRETPFYGESGGQVGDTGTITCANATLDVLDTQKVGPETIVHLCRVKEGELVRGERVRLEVDSLRRQRIRLNHSATHILHLALREVLGAHVKQAGSRVSDRNFRFDFNHHEPVSPSQLDEISDIANRYIQENHAVEIAVLPIEEAKRSGAVALFGEKYGEIVRVVTIGPRSKEFCGGIHAKYAGDLGCLVLAAESSVAAGVRRIEAIAGMGAVRRQREEEKLLGKLVSSLKTNKEEVLERLNRVLNRVKEVERELNALKQQQSLNQGGDLLHQALVLADGTKIVAGKFSDISPGQLRALADDLRARIGTGAIALAGINDGKAVLLIALTEDLLPKYHAGKLMEVVASVAGSKGGGKADLAQAGGGDPALIEDALMRFRQLLQ